MTVTSSTSLSIAAELVLPGDASVTVGVGEPFWLSIEARHAPGRIALLPQAIELGKSIGERTGARLHERTQVGGDEIDHYRLELIAFDPGDLTVPAIPLALGSTTAKTPELAVSVASGFSGDEQKVAASTLTQAIPELEKLAAQDPAPQAITGPDYTILWAGGAVLFVAIAAYVILKVLKARRDRPVPAPPPPPPRPAHEVAFERLDALAAAGHPRDGALKEFFTELSEILREYTGGRYGFDSLDLTVDELMDALGERRVDGLRDLLARADLVKFAKYRPTRDEAVEAFDQARAIVEATRPKEATP